MLKSVAVTVLVNNKSIVALESTLISHGLPYPANIKVANDSIKAVEESGSVAATIGIIKGEIKIGLNDEDLWRRYCNYFGIRSNA